MGLTDLSHSRRLVHPPDVRQHGLARRIAHVDRRLGFDQIKAFRLEAGGDPIPALGAMLVGFAEWNLSVQSLELLNDAPISRRTR